jgi:sugar phosphate isomerase/epimerase
MTLLGAHSHLFRGHPAAVAGEFRRHGLTCVQLTPAFPDLHFQQPGDVTPDRCRRASEPFHAAGIAIAALSGMTNLMDPDLERRHRGIMRWHALIRHCRAFGTDRIVTETGSLSPRSPWAPHPPNRSAEAWTELCLIMGAALRLAADHGVTLLLKAEGTQVLATVEDAIRLREELGHAHLGFVMDPANFLLESPMAELSANLEMLCRRLGPLAPLVHAKDIRFAANGAVTPCAGRGVLDYALFLKRFRPHQPGAPIILEHLRPQEIGATKAFMESMLRLEPA